MPRIRHLFRGFRTNLWALLADRRRAGPAERRSPCWRRRSSTAARCSTRSRRAPSPTKRWWPSARVEGAMLFGIVCALPTLLAVWFAPALVVFQDCGAAAGARDEPARRAGQLAAARRLRPAALLLRRRAAGNGDRDHRRSLAPRDVAPYVIALIVVPYSSCSSPRRRSPTTSLTATSSIAGEGDAPTESAG